MNTLKEIELWHEKACPNPDADAFNVQFGCHVEEFAELLDSIQFDNEDDDRFLRGAHLALVNIATVLKKKTVRVSIIDRKEFLDALADGIVTAVGAGYRAAVDVPSGAVRVNQSNWSKFDENGEPIFDENGKVKKGPGYTEPDLTGLY